MKNLYCPKCKVILTKVYQQDIETHVCFSCKGKWIDDPSVKKTISNLRYVGVSECENMKCPFCLNSLFSKTFLTSTDSFKAAQCQSCKSIWIKFNAFNSFINLVKVDKTKSKSRNTFKLKAKCPKCQKPVEDNYCQDCKIKFKINIETDSKSFNWAIPGCVFSIAALIACLYLPIIIIPIVLFVVIPGYIFSKKNKAVTTEINKFTDMDKCFACGTNIPQTDNKCPKCFARFDNKLNKKINQIDIILHEMDKELFQSLLDQEKIEKLKDSYQCKRKKLVNELTGYQEVEEKVIKKEIIEKTKEILVKEEVDNKFVEKEIEEKIKAKLAENLAKEKTQEKPEYLPVEEVAKEKEIAKLEDQEKEEFFKIKEEEAKTKDLLIKQEIKVIEEITVEEDKKTIQVPMNDKKELEVSKTKSAEEEIELFEPDFSLDASMSEPMLPGHEDKKEEKTQQDIAVEQIGRAHV